MHAVITHGLPNKLAQIMPLGIMNPLVICGKYIPNLVLFDGKNLRINPDVIASLSPLRQIYRHDKRLEETRKLIPGICRGCPVSFKGTGIKESGIDCLSAAYLDTYEKQRNVKIF